MTDKHAGYANQLRLQAKTVERPTTLFCPYCPQGRMFQSENQLWDHAALEHVSAISALGESTEARAVLREEGLCRAKAQAGHFSNATAGGGSTLDLTPLSLLESPKESSPPLDPRPRSGKKRPAASDLHPAAVRQDPTRRSKAVGPIKIADTDYSGDLHYSFAPEVRRPKSSNPRLYGTNQDAKGLSSSYLRSTPNHSSEDWSVEANKSMFQKNPHSASLHSPMPRKPAKRAGQASPPRHSLAPKAPSGTQQLRQPGVIEVQRSDSRHPDLLLQPESRPISQEQLASEVKSIYAGLTMVEAKCIHVDRAQASAVQECGTNPVSKLANDHWQALIALHRTLLHEHHDFFLASQHPSASPALRRLASKYSMPARMWKHGIFSFLELLRRHLPASLDYMLAFIYLAYQMMALLYETVPAFEDTWIECLGDLGRYRMAIEDEDVRDREIWAGVARSWYSKAADKNPCVGRLYHHLAILARPNALQQLYYYARSLTCVKPFASARESILTLLDPILGRVPNMYSHALPIDTNFIQAHGILFEKLPQNQFQETVAAFQSQLDNYIGRVTAKWKEQGVYIAVTNIAGLFDYGSNSSVLRQLFELHAKQTGGVAASSRSSSPSDGELSRSPSPVDASSGRFISEAEVPSKLEELTSHPTFSAARHFAFSTLQLVLRRVGDKNVLPHVHVLLSFLSSIASVPYVSPLVTQAPWSELVAFLNILLKSETREKITPSPLFPGQKQNDTRPLPEDYLIRGQIWSQWYFPDNWFDGEHDEEERSLELASTVKSRIERIIRLGCHVSKLGHWISYDQDSCTFSVASSGNL
ncbi:hypothetical protein GQ43DRAFT_377600 [Delitschia confertaspora ATCC 74209]|uniref:DNA/RNA-binding domain-containing protein n=1 Tax=Delitschia confertaspora ATCC 74209 TaxID=1513339 RepID=A0A9P4JGP7_9PLEO|nr:hypothetical protein GQ43DRAFT_377600 [Delitschia confertaspora ATCC 74209]